MLLTFKAHQVNALYVYVILNRLLKCRCLLQYILGAATHPHSGIQIDFIVAMGESTIKVQCRVGMIEAAEP